MFSSFLSLEHQNLPEDFELRFQVSIIKKSLTGSGVLCVTTLDFSITSPHCLPLLTFSTTKYFDFVLKMKIKSEKQNEGLFSSLSQCMTDSLPLHHLC